MIIGDLGQAYGAKIKDPLQYTSALMAWDLVAQKQVWKVDLANAEDVSHIEIGFKTSFWERRVSTDIVSPGGDDNKVPLSRSRDRFIDVAHKVDPKVRVFAARRGASRSS